MITDMGPCYWPVFVVKWKHFSSSVWVSSLRSTDWKCSWKACWYVYGLRIQETCFANIIKVWGKGERHQFTLKILYQLAYRRILPSTYVRIKIQSPLSWRNAVISLCWKNPIASARWKEMSCLLTCPH